MSGARNWTKDQSNAIYSRGGGLLVSAAAGSGKTAVLVERVIRRVCSEAVGCPIDRLLVVTFTNAAAAEMRERIAAALEKELAAHPQDAYLLRQQMLLPSADICTMDSFCSALVKTHFHAADVSPDFRILSDGESEALQREILKDCLQELYAQDTPALDFLTGVLTRGSNDGDLQETLLTLYTNAQAYPYPEHWLRSIPGQYDPTVPVQETAWGKVILREAKRRAEDCRYTLDSAVKALEAEPELADAYALLVSSDRAFLDALEARVDARDWDGVVDTLAAFRPLPLKGTPKGYKDHPAKMLFQQARTENKEKLRKLISLFPANAAEHREDMTRMQPAIQLLIDTVLRFSEKLFDAKKAENAYDFSDISHLALQLLVRIDPKTGAYARTPLAESLRAQYREILLDEYQDTNDEQEALFTALSDDETNLFCVGDIKQSIYSFRLAVPDLFLRRRAAACDYDGAHFPARITLSHNFRSRKAVCEGINRLFSQIMTKETCGIEYGETERLNPAASFPGEDPAVELHILEKDALDDPVFFAEPVHIAAYIRKLVDDGTPVSDGQEGQRPVRYGDICILMRSLSDYESYMRALELYGVPAYSQKNGGFFQMREIRTVVSLLEAINDPFADVPLCAALYSPIWGFTPDELAEIKMAGQGLPFYRKLTLTHTKKCERFLRDFERLHTLSTVLTPVELLREIYESTAFFAICGALPGGEDRKRNLLLLLQYAEEYGAHGKNSLSGFLRYLERLRSAVGAVESPSGVSEFANVVRILSIHKSKGLEFPVVILARCGSAFNEKELNKKMVLHPKLLLGCKVYDAAGARVYPSVPLEAVKLAKRADLRAEELRILYVAMTRAKERLVVVGQVGARMKSQTQLRAAAFALSDGKVRPSYVRDSNTYLSWILAAWMLHPDADWLRGASGCLQPADADAAFRLRVAYYDSLDLPEQTPKAVQTAAVNAEMLAELTRRLSFRYPYLALQNCPAKVSASALNEQSTQQAYFAQARPAFLGKGGLTPAMRGTATHTFVQFCDFAAAAADLEPEIQRLQTTGVLSQEEAEVLDRSALRGFFDSALFARMQRAASLERERKFTVLLPAGEFLGEMCPAAEESILLQGVMDCIFTEGGSLVLVDYKTDRVRKPEELVTRYREQMRAYARAAQQLYARRVDEIYLYSFSLGEAVSVNI